MSSSVGMNVRVYLKRKWQPGKIVHEEMQNDSKVFKVKLADGAMTSVNTTKDKYIIIGNYPTIATEASSRKSSKKSLSNTLLADANKSAQGLTSEKNINTDSEDRIDLAEDKITTKPKKKELTDVVIVPETAVQEDNSTALADASGETTSAHRVPVEDTPKPIPRWDANIEIKILDKSVYVDLDKKGLPWCRYCGARDTSGWSRGPWASKTLCIPHYVAWWQKKKLDLSAYAHELPTEPINPRENTEFKYIAWKKEKAKKIESQKLQAKAQRPVGSNIDEAEFAKFAANEQSAADRAGRRISVRAIRAKYLKMKDDKEREIKMIELKKQEEIEKAKKRERRRQLEEERKREQERVEALRKERQEERLRRKQEAEEMKALKKREREQNVVRRNKAKRKKTKSSKKDTFLHGEDATATANKVSWTASSAFSPVNSELPSESMGTFWTRPRRG